MLASSNGSRWLEGHAEHHPRVAFAAAPSPFRRPDPSSARPSRRQSRKPCGVIPFTQPISSRAEALCVSVWSTAAGHSPLAACNVRHPERHVAPASSLRCRPGRGSVMLYRQKIHAPPLSHIKLMSLRTRITFLQNASGALRVTKEATEGHLTQLRGAVKGRSVPLFAPI